MVEKNSDGIGWTHGSLIYTMMLNDYHILIFIYHIIYMVLQEYHGFSKRSRFSWPSLPSDPLLVDAVTTPLGG